MTLFIFFSSIIILSFGSCSAKTSCPSGTVGQFFGKRAVWPPHMVQINFDTTTSKDVTSILVNGIFSEMTSMIANSYQLDHDINVIAYNDMSKKMQFGLIIHYSQQNVTYHVDNPFRNLPQTGAFFTTTESLYYCGKVIRETPPIGIDNKCGRFNKETKTFDIIESMTHSYRQSPSVVTIQDKPCMFGDLMEPTQCLNLDTLQWETDHLLPTIQKEEQRMIIHNSILYSCGGLQMSEVYEKCDRFNLNTNKPMTSVPFPIIKRRSFHLFIKQNRVVAAGIVANDSRISMGNPMIFDVQSGEKIAIYPEQFLTHTFISICGIPNNSGAISSKESINSSGLNLLLCMFSVLLLQYK